MGFDEYDFDFGELMIDKLGQIETGGQTNVVGGYFSEGFDSCYTWTRLDSRSDDVLFLVSGLLGMGLLGGNGDD